MEIYDLCLKCAREIYGTRPAHEHYAKSVANMLYATAIVESNLKTRRQYGFKLTTDRGAFSYWQVERVSVEASVDLLKRNDALHESACKWLFGKDWARAKEEGTIFLLTWDAWKALLLVDDRVGCLLSRLHYMRFINPIPSSLIDQAQYWKSYYNTNAGKGTVSGFIQAVKPVSLGLY